MSAMKTQLVFVCLVMATSSILLSTSAEQLTYTCYPNATLMVENPGNYTSVFANNSQQVCTTRWASDKTLAYIDNCSMDDDVLVYFSYLDSNFNQVIGGAIKMAYKINCEQIPLGGEKKTISNSMDVNIQALEKSTHTPLSDGFKISSGIYTDLYGINMATEFKVGTPLFWIMNASISGYTIRPDECTAYAGKEVKETVQKKIIYQNGCTTNDELVLNFKRMPSRGNTDTKYSFFYVFRFYASDYVTIECKVRVCPYPHYRQTASFCDATYCASRKKRSYRESSDVNEVKVQTYFHVTGQASNASLLDSHKEWFAIHYILALTLYRLWGQ